MASKKLSIEKLEAIEAQITEATIPYVYDTKEYPVEVIVAKYDKEQIFVPHYQREFVWKTNQKSRFIESVFLGVPIMPFLVSVSGEEAELEIIDGSQRIRTLVDYCSNKLRLSKLDKLTELNGTKFEDLPESRRNKFLLRDFRFHVVTDKATPDIRADIFNRVNTSSNKLSDSETRKGALQGDFYRFIIECAQSKVFRTICPIPEAKALRGEYEELALRFFAYSESYLEFKHDVAPFLDSFVKKQKKGFDKEELQSNFELVNNFILTYFPAPYCATANRPNATPRVRFEAISVGIYLALKQNPQLKDPNLTWLQSDEFKFHTTSDASNNQGKLKARIEFVRDCILGINNNLHFSNE